MKKKFNGNADPVMGESEYSEERDSKSVEN